MTDIFLYPQPQGDKNDVFLLDPTQSLGGNNYLLLGETGVFTLTGNAAQLSHEIPLPFPVVHEESGYYREYKRPRVRVRRAPAKQYRLVAETVRYRIRTHSVNARVDRRVLTTSVSFNTIGYDAKMRYEARLATLRSATHLKGSDVALLRTALLLTTGWHGAVDEGKTRGELRRVLHAQQGNISLHASDVVRFDRALETLHDDDLLFLLEVAA